MDWPGCRSWRDRHLERLNWVERGDKTPEPDDQQSEIIRNLDKNRNHYCFNHNNYNQRDVILICTFFGGIPNTLYTRNLLLDLVKITYYC